jgi:hypothetical protein
VVDVNATKRDVKCDVMENATKGKIMRRGKVNAKRRHSTCDDEGENAEMRRRNRNGRE